MTIIQSPLEIEFHGFVVGQADGRGSGGAAVQVDEVQLDVFRLLLALGYRRSHESELAAVVRNADLTHMQRRSCNRDCSRCGAGIFHRVRNLFGTERGVARQGIVER